jgi:hypothetical protein
MIEASLREIRREKIESNKKEVACVMIMLMSEPGHRGTHIGKFII